MCLKALAFLIILYVLSYRWVNFSRAVLFLWLIMSQWSKCHFNRGTCLFYSRNQKQFPIPQQLSPLHCARPDHLAENRKTISSREQEDHIQHCTITTITSLHSDMHWERERGVAYLRQIILSQLYLEARMRRLGSIMPPRRRSTRCRVDSATHSHIYCRVQTGAQTGVQTGARTYTVHNNQRQRSGGREWFCHNLD